MALLPRVKPVAMAMAMEMGMGMGMGMGRIGGR